MSGWTRRRGPRSARAPSLWSGRGSVPSEFVLAVGLLLLPVTMLVAVFPAWAERQSMARLAAGEAAREAALAVSPADGIARAVDLASQIAANHGVPPDDFTVHVTVPADPVTGSPQRGGEVEALVTVRMPLVAVPLVGEVGGFSWTVERRARIDDYRSFPP